MTQELRDRGPVAQKYYGTKLIEAWWEGKGGKDSLGDRYVVKYADGYMSWSPKEVFEKAYQPLHALSFGHAIEAMKAGDRVARSGWNGKNMWIAIQTPGEPSKMKKPYIYMRPVDGEFVPWLASQTDMLANDWQVVID